MHHGARDDYIYIDSHDDRSAYQISDHMVMARVSKNSVSDVFSYEYFTDIKDGEPTWSVDVRQRRPVFTNPGKCYRSSVSYNEGSGRCFFGAGVAMGVALISCKVA
ncbi:MAG: hypothetical protein HKN87_00885 [Saprospiraceae bacterium]|nr:hypothetical protein [Saprospiraceae bacterium]